MPAALVTGGARRVGRAIVEDLARNGWSIAVHYLSGGDEAEALAGSIRAGGGNAVAVQCDLADLAQTRSVVETSAAALGPLTLLVNNASMYAQDAFGALEPQAWWRQLAVNLGAPVFLSQAFVGQVGDATDANIVNLLDPRIYRPNPDYFTYQLSKAGLMAATETMAKALAPRVRVNGISPGPVLPSAHTNPERYAKRISQLPLQRAPGLDEFGRTVRYFVENTSVTGQVISIDAGQRLA